MPSQLFTSHKNYRVKLAERLEGEHSSSLSQEIAEQALENRSLVPQLLKLMLGDDVSMAQRAAWPLGMLGTKKPELLLPYFPEMLKALDHPQHPAIKRNVYRTLQFMEIPEQYRGKLFEMCTEDLSHPKMPAAIRVFAMTVAFNISQAHPELKPELKILIEEGMSSGTAGYRIRGEKILRKL